MLTATSTTPYSRLTAGDQGHLAYMRFGLGPKPDTPPEHWRNSGAAFAALKAELTRPEAVRVADRPQNKRVVNGSYSCDPFGVATTADCAAALANRIAMGGRIPGGLPERDGDLRARFRIAQYPTIGFVERLVLFWSNHFNVQWGKGITTHYYTGHMERTVIRPNVLGSFADMLKGVVKHPAMLAYLDNGVNIGPNSQYKGHVGKHLNENLAREVLELHTVGNCYSQADVMSLAAILTGFKVSTTSGMFEYERANHEPGSFTVLGTSYPQTYSTSDRARQTWSNMTPAQLDNVLNDLAVRPETARHLAKKMIRHFITDNPPEDAIAAVAAAFGPTGDLRAMADKLLDLKIGWAPASEIPYRLRTPQLSVVAMNRALSLTDDDINRTLGQRFEFLGPLNHNVWERVSPDGYPDLNAAWINEGAFRARTQLTYTYVVGVMANRRARFDGQVLALADSLFPGFLSATTREVITKVRRRRSDSNSELALLFLSTEYLRR